MKKESPAERMHNRILNGSAFSIRGVTADAFRSVAQSAGTLALPNIKQALVRLEKSDKN